MFPRYIAPSDLAQITIINMDTNKSAEELEQEKSDSKISEEKLKAEEEAAAEAKAKAEAENKEEEDLTKVPLSEYTRTKEILWRMTKDIVDDEDKLAELAETDPKRLERLKVEFPKLFKDIKIPVKNITDEDIEARVNAAVAKQLTSSGKSDALKALQDELKMTDMEFLDIKGEIADKAEHLMNIEMSSNYKDAVLLAYKNLNPKKFKEIMEKQAAKDILDRKKNAKAAPGQGADGKKFSQLVMDNYARLGFKSPQEMVDYQDPKKVIGIM